jgi:hypothetical protein
MAGAKRRVPGKLVQTKKNRPQCVGILCLAFNAEGYLAALLAYAACLYSAYSAYLYLGFNAEIYFNH